MARTIPTARPATPAQIKFAEDLMDRKAVDIEPYGLACPAVALEEMTGPMISGLIDYLKALPYPVRPAVAPAASAELEAGMYRLPTGEIFKVQQAIHGSGRMYAKALMVEEDEDNPGETLVWFEMARGAIRRIRAEHRMSLEDAKAFGALYGVCCVCGITLTDETSIAEGIGPVCGGRV